ncbi:MAG: acyl-CoA dehydrogenase family protein [Leucobacter sp.]
MSEQLLVPNADFLLFEQSLTPSERATRDRVRHFVDDRITPTIGDYWDRAEFPSALLPEFAELGIAGTTIQGYGCPGMGIREQGIQALELARGDGSINTFFAVHSGLAMGTINTLASDEQKQRWLPRMARLEMIGAFALTEPEHGSDSVALETHATRVGDTYVLNGRKRWIGNGSIADIVIIWARDTADGEVKAFILEREPGAPYPAGYTPSVITGKIGKRAIWQADIEIQDLEIPAENLLANSTNFKDAVEVLNATRMGASWEALGHGVAAFELAQSYALERRQFGSTIGSFQLVQNLLAKMLSEVSAMYALCFRAGDLAENGDLTGPMSSLLKLHTADKSRWVCRSARDLMGGNGLLLERHVSRHLTDMEVVHTYEGTEFIQSLLVGRELTGVSAFSARHKN